MVWVQGENLIHAAFLRALEQDGIVNGSALNSGQSGLAEQGNVLGSGKTGDLEMFQNILLNIEEGLLRGVAGRWREPGKDRVHFSKAVSSDKSGVPARLNTLQQWKGSGVRIVLGDDSSNENAGVQKNCHFRRPTFNDRA